MTEERLEKANYILKEIHWCQGILDHIANNHKITIGYEYGEIDFKCTEHETCPEWLKEAIEHAVTKRRDEFCKVFMEI